MLVKSLRLGKEEGEMKEKAEKLMKGISVEVKIKEIRKLEAER